MAQSEAWEKEYRNPTLMTKKPEPQSDFLRFLKFLHKKEKVHLEKLYILDLGSGTGRNSNYVAHLGNTVVGMELSKTATDLARSRAQELSVDVDYRIMNIGSHYPFPDESFDIILDITSSNSLNEKERALYLSETFRVLKKGGYFFVKALCKDGDANAKTLLILHPGTEYDTYRNPDMNVIERVFSQTDFMNLYSPHFKIIHLEKKTNYPRSNGRVYKRNYWLAYMKKG